MGNENDNTAEHIALDRRVTKTEKEIADILSAVGEQGKQIASLTTAIETQTRQLGSLFSRTEREKPPWGVILMGVSVMIILAGLALTPIYQDIAELKSNDALSNAHRELDAYEMGRMKENIRWQEKRGDGLVDRTHAIYKD